MLSFRVASFLLQCSFVFLQSCRSVRAQQNSDPWHLHPFRMLQTNLRAIDADLDINKTLDFLEQHGANAWLLSIGGILANYPTELDFQSYNSLQAEGRASGDMVLDAREASRARNVRLLGRMDFSKVEIEIADTNPEWAYISPEGDRQIHHAHGKQLVSMCPSGEWYQSKIFEILDEVTSRYELDGFFINWSSYNENDYNKTYVGVCHCEACQTRWDEYSDGKDLPDGPANETYPEWKRFSDGMIATWTSTVREYIAERLPNAALIQRRQADVMFHEANNGVDRTFWKYATGEAASIFQSVEPEVPILINAASFLDHGYRICSEQPENYIQYFIQAISRGANPSTYIIGLPEGEIEWLGLPNAGQISRFHRDNSDVYEGIRPAATVALVQPSESAFDNDTRYEESESEYRGLYQALQELHVPFDIMSQSNLRNASGNGSLDRYRLVILPDLGELSSSAATALDDWVAAAPTHNLLTTGAVGWHTSDENAIQLSSLPAERLLDNITSVEKLWSTYLAPIQNATAESQYTAPLIPIVSSYHRYAWKQGTTSHYRKLQRAPWAPIEYTYGNEQDDNDEEPGCAVLNHGEEGGGKGLLFTIPVGRGYREIGYSVYRDFFRLVLEEEGLLDGSLASSESAKLTFEGVPEQIEVTVNRNRDNATVVHLINHSGARGQNYGSHVALGESVSGNISVSGGAALSARALVSGAALQIVDGLDNGELSFKLPSIDLFEVVVIDGL